MKSTRLHWCSFLTAIVFVLFASTAYAQVPATIGYSGTLADEAGVFTGTVDIDLNLFNEDGAWLWGEAHPDTVVEDGAFWLSIGSHMSLPEQWNDSESFLEFTINEQILEPRIALEAVPFARIAESSVNPDGVFVGGTRVISPEGEWTGQSMAESSVETSELLERIEDLELALADLEAAVYDEQTGLTSRLGPDDVTGDGVVHWNDIQDIPSGFADGVDDQATSIGWSEIEDMPAGFADGVDDQVASVGWTEIEGIPSGFADGVDDSGSTSVSWDDLTLDEGTIYQIGNELFFEGINVNIISGAPLSGYDNGLGNLIVGYQLDGDLHTGSHNVVVGHGHNYTGSGNIISGYNHDVLGDFGAAIGGQYNTVDADYSVIIGGTENWNYTQYTAAIGGYGNQLGDPDGSLVGSYAVAVGGRNNHAYGSLSATLGGEDNTTTALFSFTVGGDYNHAGGRHSGVIGGGGGSPGTLEDYGNDTYGRHSLILGGYNNVVGPDSTDESASRFGVIVGGESNEVNTVDGVVVGGSSNNAGGYGSTVVGGVGNETQYHNTVIAGSGTQL